MKREPSYFLKFVSHFCLSFLLVACVSGPSYQEEDSLAISADENEPPPKIQFEFPLKKFKHLGRGFKGKHKGLDISADRGTPIYAVESGWIIYVGRKFKGYGKLVIVEHNRSFATFYAHMTKFNVKEKDWVNKGDVLGFVGSTGRSTGNHLHFEIRYKNRPIDPTEFLDLPKR